MIFDVLQVALFGQLRSKSFQIFKIFRKYALLLRITWIFSALERQKRQSRKCT